MFLLQLKLLLINILQRFDTFQKQSINKYKIKRGGSNSQPSSLLINCFLKIEVN